MLRAVVRELTVEAGWYEELLGPMVLSLSRQEALVASLMRAAHPPPLLGSSPVQPLSPPTLPRVLSAIVGVVPDDIARSPPDVSTAVESVEMSLADRDACAGGDGAAKVDPAMDAQRRLIDRVRSHLRSHPTLEDVHALRRHLEGVCRSPSLGELRNRAERRSLISVARAAAAARGSTIATAILRPDLQYAISDDDVARLEAAAPVAASQVKLKRPAPAAALATPPPTKFSRLSGARTSAASSLRASASAASAPSARGKWSSSMFPHHA
ncbi:hypothetical protein PINS_up016972 [Pythium insidiosum]|nr:hypothetical protein PINS_up016972 [Pythium insidiosum]